MRYDYFIIWGNGINYIPEIMDIIDQEYNFRVIFEKGIVVDNIGKFIEGIYKCDTVPYKHLMAKSRYLLKAKPEIYFVLVENRDPQEKMVGLGPFAHIQCQRVTKLKIKIRNKFNPRWDKNKQLPPLDIEVSHEHVIHASDYESQVNYVLGYLGLPGLDSYHKYAHDIDIMNILSALDIKDYVVIRKNDRFPNYFINDDVDILCREMKNVWSDLFHKLKELKYDVRTPSSKQKIHHIDIYMRGVLQFRFDLVDYCAVGEDKEFVAMIIRRQRLEERIPIPSLIDDLALRYVEYLKRPHKKWHKQYCEKYSDETYKIIANVLLSKYC